MEYNDFSEIEKTSIIHINDPMTLKIPKPDPDLVAAIIKQQTYPASHLYELVCWFLVGTEKPDEKYIHGRVAINLPKTSFNNKGALRFRKHEEAIPKETCLTLQGLNVFVNLRYFIQFPDQIYCVCNNRLCLNLNHYRIKQGRFDNKRMRRIVTVLDHNTELLSDSLPARK